VSGSGGAATASVAGSPYAITSSAATGGTFAAGNYSIAYQTGSLTVTPAPLTITAITQSKAYGQALNLGTTAFTTSVLSNSDIVTNVTLSSPGAAATASVGGSPYAITASGALGTGLGNYTIAYQTGSLAVTPAPLTITAGPQSKTYGQPFNLGSTAFTTTVLSNNETVASVTLSSPGAAATATVGGSPYPITPSAATGGTFTAGNYAITYATGNLTVNLAALTITANNRTKAYGQLVTFAGTEFTTSGLFNSDTVTSVILTSVAAATNATIAGSPYSIVPSAATGSGLGNYNIGYLDGVLTVTTPPLLSITMGTFSGVTTNASGDFVLASSPAGGANPVSLVAFTNADGNVDLVIGDVGNDALTLLTNNGNGTFGSNASYSVGGQPYSMIAADVNGDGLVDLICGDYFSGTLTVYTNNGSGGFAFASAPKVNGSYPRSVAAFTNVDGTVGLVCANYVANSLTVLSNTGGGNFTIATTPAAPGNPISVAVADLNGDGLADLICANWGNGGSGHSVMVLTNNGSGGFGPGVNYNVGNAPIFVTTADVNGDGKTDIITANYLDDTLTVLTNNGNGGFVLSAILEVGLEPWSVTAADVNGDGQLDLISANAGTNTLTVYTNAGKGVFALAGVLSAGASPSVVVVADVNLDGLADAICTDEGNNTLSVLTNTPMVLTNNRPTLAISWPASPAGFSLQQNNNLATTNWTTVTSGITVVGSNNTITINASSGNGFYRLIAP